MNDKLEFNKFKYSLNEFNNHKYLIKIIKLIRNIIQLMTYN